ncbi:MAG TPA: hypothetical protein VI320_33260 [Terracidiphilus sp.]
MKQPVQSVCQDIRRDSFFGELEQISIVATITEHDVPNDDQAPAVAENLERQIDRATRANFASRLDFLHDFHHLPLAVCVESVLSLIHLHYASR